MSLTQAAPESINPQKHVFNSIQCIYFSNVIQREYLICSHVKKKKAQTKVLASTAVVLQNAVLLKNERTVQKSRNHGRNTGYDGYS